MLFQPKYLRFWLAGAALFAAALWGVVVVLANHKDAEQTARLEKTRGTVLISHATVQGGLKPTIGLEVRYTGLERTHTLGKVQYVSVPPVGGPHSSIWQNCGAYLQPVSDSTAVHSLEHGAVWITYKASLDAASVARLRAFARQPYVLVSPYPTQRAPITATAWGAQLQLDQADSASLGAFVANYANRRDGPEFGAPCVGGTGVPLGAS